MVCKNDVAEVVGAIVLWEVLELELVLNKTHPYSGIKKDLIFLRFYFNIIIMCEGMYM